MSAIVEKIGSNLIANSTERTILFVLVGSITIGFIADYIYSNKGR